MSRNQGHRNIQLIRYQVNNIENRRSANKMTALTRRSIEKVYHYTPLHYLLFIGRSNAVLCKPSLAAAGFPFSHLRSASRGRDVERRIRTLYPFNFRT